MESVEESADELLEVFNPDESAADESTAEEPSDLSLVSGSLEDARRNNVEIPLVNPRCFGGEVTKSDGAGVPSNVGGMYSFFRLCSLCLPLRLHLELLLGFSSLSPDVDIVV